MTKKILQILLWLFWQSIFLFCFLWSIKYDAIFLIILSGIFFVCNIYMAFTLLKNLK